LERCVSVLVDEAGLLRAGPNGSLLPAGALPPIVRYSSADQAIGQLLLCDIGLSIPSLVARHATLRLLRERLARLLNIGVTSHIDVPPAVEVLMAAAAQRREVTFRYRSLLGAVRSWQAIVSEPWLAAGEWRAHATVGEGRKSYVLRLDRIVSEVELVDGPPADVDAESIPRTMTMHQISLLCDPMDVAVFDRFGGTISTAGTRCRVDMELFEPLDEMCRIATQGCLHPIEMRSAPEGTDLVALHADSARRIAADYRRRQR